MLEVTTPAICQILQTLTAHGADFSAAWVAGWLLVGGDHGRIIPTRADCECTAPCVGHCAYTRKSDSGRFEGVQVHEREVRLLNAVAHAPSDESVFSAVDQTLMKSMFASAGVGAVFGFGVWAVLGMFVESTKFICAHSLVVGFVGGLGTAPPRARTAPP